MISLRSILFVSVLSIIGLFAVEQGQACDCIYWKSIRSLAEDKNVSFVKVKSATKSKSGWPAFSVEKTLYGPKIEESKIEVIGQDGENCNGTLPGSKGTWILAVVKSEDGWMTPECARTYLEPVEEGKSWNLDLVDQVAVTEDHLIEYLKGELIPSVNQWTCNVSLSSRSADYKPEFKSISLNQSFNVDVGSDAQRFKVEKDALHPGSPEYNLSCYVSKQKPSDYYLEMTLWQNGDSPFFTKMMEIVNVLGVKPDVQLHSGFSRTGLLTTRDGVTSVQPVQDEFRFVCWPNFSGPLIDRRYK